MLIIGHFPGGSDLDPIICSNLISACKKIGSEIEYSGWSFLQDLDNIYLP